MGRAPSEKLGYPTTWTTPSQARLGGLLEVTHGAVSYGPWPFKVTLRAGWSQPFEYWPAMGFTTMDGSQVAIDVVHDHDMDDRIAMDFDHLLEEALDARGIRLVRMREIHLATDRKVVIARQMARYVGTSVPAEDAEQLRGLIGRHGGRMTLGQIRTSGEDGVLRMAQACVLGMRRRLLLGLDVGGLAASTVSLCGFEGGAA
ncbi:hypothetical protein VQH23_13480 [Pararoseomonas sp. SCSIO 73927]|uniref:hypothetical protein n=1 Tax=Pararoseomonas sp. SCSIO 73927 TaxID=3114537 RepID=UPI0030D27B7E